MWSTGETTSSIDGLIGGTYSVTVTDGDGCNTVCTTNISSIGGPECTVSTTDAECGANTGAAFASATGGSGVYGYLWNTGATTPTISGLAPGPYSVTVTDSKGCITVCNTIVSTSGTNCASVGDTVWEDTNGNGIFDGSETGLEGVIVTLFDADTNIAIGTMTTLSLIHI